VKTEIKHPRRSAFTLLEILTVVTIIGLLSVIAVCNYIIARDTTRLTVIQSNLHDIESAKEQWAFENKKRAGDPVADVALLAEYLRKGGVKVVVQETYQPNPVGQPPEAKLPADVKLGPYAAGATIQAP